MNEFLQDLKVAFGKEALLKVLIKVRENDLFGLAGQLAYLFLISFFPSLIFVVALIGLVLSNPQTAVEGLIHRTSGFLPQEATTLLANYMARTLKSTNTTVLVAAILSTLWLGSGAAIAITKAANRAYNLSENRPFWKLRGIAVLIAVGFTFLMSALTLVVFKGLAYVQSPHEPGVLLRYWSVGRWAVGFVVVTLALDILYYLAPNAHLPFRWVTPGGLMATILVFVMSEGLSFYVSNLGNYGRLYGQLATVVVFMIWLFLTGLAVLVGIEVNAVITRIAEEKKQSEIVRSRHPEEQAD